MSKSDLKSLSVPIASKLGLNIIGVLGSGENGVAFDVGDRVLKITLDGGEYIQASKFKGKRTQHLSDVYGTWVLNNEKIGRIYILLKEKVKVDASSEERIRKGMESLSHQWYEQEIVNVVNAETMTEFIQSYENGSYDDDDVQRVSTRLSDENAIWYLNQMTGMLSELKSYGIVSADYWDNLGLKDNNIVYYDVGYGNMQDVEMNYLHLQEKVRSIVRNITPSF